VANPGEMVQYGDDAGAQRMRGILGYRPSAGAAVVVALVALLLPLDAFSVASSMTKGVSSLITGRQVRDGSIQHRDLSPTVRRRLRGAHGLRVNGVGPAAAVSSARKRLPRRTFVVSGADTPTRNGVKLRQTLGDIRATAARPALVLLGPGVYDVGETELAMKPFVDLQGSGEGLTRITAPGRGSELGTVAGADDAELRFLTVESSGGGAFGVAIRNPGASPRITHVTVVTGGTAATMKGILSTSSAAPLIRDTTVRVSAVSGGVGIGIQNSSAPARIERADVMVSGGLIDVAIENAASSPVRIRDSVIMARSSGDEPSTALLSSRSLVFVDGSHLSGDNAADGRSNNQYRIGTSRLDGAVTLTPSASSSRCVFSYREDYTPLGSDCHQ